MEQREQRPNLFGLCQVATEKDEVKEEDEVSCLDYAKSRQRKMKSRRKTKSAVWTLPSDRNEGSITKAGDYARYSRYLYPKSVIRKTVLYMLDS